MTATELRQRFAHHLSRLYAREVPAYQTLLDVAQQVNHRVLEKKGSTVAERLGSISRVTAERHGAIRVGSPRELRQLARVLGAFGMRPTGFYDLRSARPRPIPVVATAFRPTASHELAINPFRVFVSMLVSDDERFFDRELGRRVEHFLAERTLFPTELLSLASRAEDEGGLPSREASRLVDLAVRSLAISPEPIDQRWYAELARVSDVAADIAGVGSTHINHMTPRVLDIEDLYSSMCRLGVEMIDAIQGPPAWGGPDVLLRQTSFRALAERRVFRSARGRTVIGEVRLRFGEVEARGIALTIRGRDLHDQLVASVDAAVPDGTAQRRHDLAAELWRSELPNSEFGLWAEGLAHFRYEVVSDPVSPFPLRPTMENLIRAGWVRLEPIVYEDFLPRSAAGIFASNLTARGAVTVRGEATEKSAAWLEGVLDRELCDPAALYAAESDQSAAKIAAKLGLARQTLALPAGN